jgi:hypothetical protein
MGCAAVLLSTTTASLFSSISNRSMMPTSMNSVGRPSSVYSRAESGQLDFNHCIAGQVDGFVKGRQHGLAHGDGTGLVGHVLFPDDWRTGILFQ